MSVVVPSDRQRLELPCLDIPVTHRRCYAHVRIQYRTPTQLGLLERFDQTLKTEEVHWKLYASPAELLAFYDFPRVLRQTRDRLLAG